MTDNGAMDGGAIAQAIIDGRTSLGIELGSTRIKGVLLDQGCRIIASGGHQWENRQVDGVWTYGLDEAWAGVQACFADVTRNVADRYGVRLETLGALGVSGMMHGYLVFDAAGDLLVPFRTWRNTMTGQASAELGELLGVNIPQRWSTAHVYQAILNGEEHIGRIASLTTLAGTIHEGLTGRRVVGVGEASGMFPLDAAGRDFDAARLAQFDERTGGRVPWRLGDILPEVLPAGADAGTLTAAGALLLDPTGALRPGVPLCPPEGDAGTGMVACNAVRPRTGSVSVGTSVFALLVTEDEIPFNPEIDVVATPDGAPTALVHGVNGAGDLDAWVALFGEFAALIGAEVSGPDLYRMLLGSALTGDADGGGLLAYNYLSGEHVTGFTDGRPLLARSASAKLTLANLFRTHLQALFGPLRVGYDELRAGGISVDLLMAHGGVFKTEGPAQRVLAAALGAPVGVAASAGEGGAFGMALLAAFCRQADGRTLPDFLDAVLGADAVPVSPDPDDVAGFDAFIARYRAGLPIEAAAVEHLARH